MQTKAISQSDPLKLTLNNKNIFLLNQISTKTTILPLPHPSPSKKKDHSEM
jgi:hypothetical protein